MIGSSFAGRNTNGRIAPVKAIFTSSLSMAFNASIMYFELNEIFNSSPEIESTAISGEEDRKSTRLNSSHVSISYAVFCLKKKKNTKKSTISTVDTNVDM